MTLKTSDEVEKFLNLLSSDQILGYDCETSGLRWQNGFVCGYGISDGKEAYYIPVRHLGGGNIENFEAFEKEMAVRIKNRRKKIVGHNIKFDIHFSENHGVILDNVVDTMVQAALLDENRNSYSLKNICKLYPDIEQKNDTELYQHLSSLFGGTPTAKSMGNYHLLRGDDPIGVSYAKSDNIAVKQLYDKQFKQLYSEQLDVVAEMEAKLTYVLQKMERKGISIDIPEIEPLKKEIDELHLEAYAKIPLSEDLVPINVKSSKDLQQYFEYINITDWPVTQLGNPSFNKLYLETITEGEVILQARKLDHFVNSFITPLNTHIYNGRIHTNFNQARGEFGGAKPGRLSSTTPNMQQVPKRDKFLGKRFRKIFVADEGFVFVELDYSQAEPRLFSHYSGEPVLINGYNQTPYIDMHSIAADLMHIERSVAKNLNLGMQYGMGAAKLALQLGITYDEARAIVKTWYKTFTRVGSFSKHAAEVYEFRGYVKTILGRRARCTDARFAYRAANRIVQGGSADILKWKIVELDRWITRNNYEDRVQIILNIHDSLLFQIRKDSLHLIAQIKSIMENVQEPPFSLKVPFVVEHEEPGENWSDATYGQPKLKEAA